MAGLCAGSTEGKKPIRCYPIDGECLSVDDIYYNWEYEEGNTARTSPTNANKYLVTKKRRFRVYFFDESENPPYTSFGYIHVCLHIEDQLATYIDEMYHHTKYIGPLVWDKKETNRSPRRQVPWMAIVEFFLGTSFMTYTSTSAQDQRPDCIHVSITQDEIHKLKNTS